MGGPPQSYIIDVFIRPDCYRKIQISGENTLHELSSIILDSFDFMDDHNHAFFLDNEPWSDADCYYRHGNDDNRQSTAEVTLSQAGLREGQDFLYLFDFGDEWEFQCTVVHISNDATNNPTVLERHGNPPNQYGDPDEEEDNGYYARPGNLIN